MKVVIASDHGGFEYKQRLVKLFSDQDYEISDLGAFNDSPSDYPDYAEAVASAILNGKAEKGILICGSGAGVSVAANKFKGIRAAVCHDTYSAHQCVEHAILDYKLALQLPYTYARNNDEGIEGPSPFWRMGAASLKKFVEISDNEGFDFTTNLHQYTTKVLFLYSENNKAYGQAFANKEAAFFPNPQVSRVNGTGHEMIYFKWDNVAALALPYLNSLR